MGRALEPGLTIELWLDWDESKPKETRPVFFTRSLSIRSRDQLARAYDEFFESLRGDEGTAERLRDGTVDLLAQCVTGWKNQFDPLTGSEINFSRDAFQDVLTQSEAFELIRKVISGADPTTEEKKS